MTENILQHQLKISNKECKCLIENCAIKLQKSPPPAEIAQLENLN